MLWGWTFRAFKTFRNFAYLIQRPSSWQGVKFWERWNFPNVIGCIDGKHICIICPTKTGSLFYNYKQFISVVLQGVTDSESRFIVKDIGVYGKQSDCGTFSAATLYHFLEDSESTLPKSASFQGSGREMPFVILGEEAYPLKTYLMKPFARKDLSCEECVFNYRLSQARRCVECAFGILTAKWWLLNKAIQTNVNKAERIVKCMFTAYHHHRSWRNNTWSFCSSRNFIHSWIPSGQNKCQQ